MKKRRVLVICPHFSEQGGVSSYYSLVQKHFKSNKISLFFFPVGSRGKETLLVKIIKTAAGIFKLCKVLPRYNLIVLNPSLDMKSLFRDGTFHLLAKMIFRRKTIVFFRGWSHEIEQKIDLYYRRIFKFIFKPTKVLVLSERIRDKFRSWGYENDEVSIETTTFENFDIETTRNPLNIAFLSRFCLEKGCLEAIQTIEGLVEEFPDLKLYMIGDGQMKEELESYVFSNELSSHVKFTGWLEGEKKNQQLAKCGIMLFPTNYGEGMPNSILEGMGAGLAIVTRPVEGIVDVVKDGRNGFLIDSMDPYQFSQKVKCLLGNLVFLKDISRRNSKEASERYEIKNVVKRLESLWLEV